MIVTSPGPAVSIVVPALDELEGARRLIEQAEDWRSSWPFELLFVDGGSQDGTVELLRTTSRSWLRAVFMERGTGLAEAWRAGLDGARGEIRVTMDADGVHTLDGVERLVDAVSAGADLAIARRYGPAGSGMPGRSGSARLASWLAARAFSARFRLGLHDPLHGLRARSRRAHEALRGRLATVDGNVFLGWETVWAVRLGHRVTEVPIRYGRRFAGKDKKRLVREGLRLARLLTVGPPATATSAGPAAVATRTDGATPAPQRPALDLRILSHYPQVREIRRGGMPFPRTAIVYPVYGCNLTCPACEYSADNEGGPTQLPLPRWQTLLDELAAGGTTGVEFCGGGEPMLHTGLVDAVLHGARAGLRFGILTNGTAVSERFLADALPHFSYVRVSIDAATAETYGRVRPGRGPVLWPRVVENCRRLLAARRPGTEISLKFLIDRVNRHELGAAVDLARSLGVSTLQFKAARQTPAALTEQEAAEAQRELEALRARAAPLPVLGGVGKLTMRRACELSPIQTTVDARGDVFLCCYYTHRRDRHRIGNVLAQPFGAVWGSARHRQAIATIRPDECSVFDCRFVRYHDVLDAWEGARGDGLAFI